MGCVKDVRSYRSVDDDNILLKTKFKASEEASNLERNRTRWNNLARTKVEQNQEGSK